MREYKRIAKECFWDLNINEYDIMDIFKNGNEIKKRLLFEKILQNSSRLFFDMKFFKKQELAKFLDEYKVPSYNSDYMARRKNLIEVYFFDKPLTINELKWIA
ncbi:MAG: hypothetical protein M0P02_06515 [Sulfurospirillaceae bacterium]|jgi:hypothetical protein|nr:hypothetical protein [Sulfurospirillaceae bacterium]MCK9546590.1 hypothetical protein [Sulfurospirillaceae bacterium]